MYQNYGCCTPPYAKKDECCCKDGIICALDFFYQDSLSIPSCITNLKYYPELPAIDGVTIPNTIFQIIYITPDIVVTYPDDTKEDTVYLSICKLNGFQFNIDSLEGCQSKEMQIISKFNKIKYVSPNGCCCKSGVLEYLLKARDFLELNHETRSVILSTTTNSFRVNYLIAINPETVWGKYVTNGVNPTTTYYVLSLCEIEGITLDNQPFIGSV